MRPYIEFNGEKLNLPQSVDPYKFEVCTRSNKGINYFILCRKVSTRYRQATGVVLERKGKELDFHISQHSYKQTTFPLEGSELIKIQIDWNAGSTTIIREE